MCLCDRKIYKFKMQVQFEGRLHFIRSRLVEDLQTQRWTLRLSSLWWYIILTDKRLHGWTKINQWASREQKRRRKIGGKQWQQHQKSKSRGSEDAEQTDILSAKTYVAAECASDDPALKKNFQPKLLQRDIWHLGQVKLRLSELRIPNKS